LPAFADTSDEPLVEVDGRAFKPDRLADPEAGAVQQLDERSVPERAGARPVRSLDQPLGLACGKRPRKLAGPARRGDSGGGGGADQRLVLVERAEGGQPARQGGVRAPGGAEVLEVALDLLRRSAGDGTAESRGEVLQVAAVAVDCPRREPCP